MSDYENMLENFKNSDPMWKIEYQDVNKEILKENETLREQNEELKIYIQAFLNKYKKENKNA